MTDDQGRRAHADHGRAHADHERTHADQDHAHADHGHGPADEGQTHGHHGHGHHAHGPARKGRPRKGSLGAWIVNFLWKRRHAAVLRHVRGQLLDIGCGENRLVRAHHEGIGVDVLQWGDVDLVVENAARLPLESGTFDTVTFIACLNHIPNREEVMAEARRVVKDDGRLIATMIPPRLSAIWHAIIRPWDPDQHGRHLHEGEVWGLTNREMRDLIENHGFEIIRHERFVFGLNNLFVAVPRPR